MKYRRLVAISSVFLFLVAIAAAHGGSLDGLLKSLPFSTKQAPDNETTISGLKEALTIGIGNAVASVSQLDGYFGNKMIKILLPEKIQNVTHVLAKVGFQKQVDEFVLSMNRAAEKASPKAKRIFIDAVKGMTFDDGRKILQGGDTAATDFFKEKTSPKLYEAFKPIISSSMNKVGTTKRYKELMGTYEAIPFVSKESFDLDHYVTNKALDGLFYMVGQEEKKIRTDPTARITDLLKTVFGK